MTETAQQEPITITAAELQVGDRVEQANPALRRLSYVIQQVHQQPAGPFDLGLVLARVKQDNGTIDDVQFQADHQVTVIR